MVCRSAQREQRQLGRVAHCCVSNWIPHRHFAGRKFPFPSIVVNILMVNPAGKREVRGRHAMGILQARAVQRPTRLRQQRLSRRPEDCAAWARGHVLRISSAERMQYAHGVASIEYVLDGPYRSRTCCPAYTTPSSSMAAETEKLSSPVGTSAPFWCSAISKIRGQDAGLAGAPRYPRTNNTVDSSPSPTWWGWLIAGQHHGPPSFGSVTVNATRVVPAGTRSSAASRCRRDL